MAAAVAKVALIVNACTSDAADCLVSEEAGKREGGKPTHRAPNAQTASSQRRHDVNQVDPLEPDLAREQTPLPSGPLLPAVDSVGVRGLTGDVDVVGFGGVGLDVKTELPADDRRSSRSALRFDVME